MTNVKRTREDREKVERFFAKRKKKLNNPLIYNFINKKENYQLVEDAISRRRYFTTH